jgi:hypothetical protein
LVGCSLHGGMSIHAHKPPTIGDRRAQSTPSPQCNSWRHPFSRAGAWVSSARIHKQHDKAGSSTKHTTRMFPVNAAAAPLTATTQGCQNMLLQSLLCDCLPTCQSQQHVTISTLKNSQLLYNHACCLAVSNAAAISTDGPGFSVCTVDAHTPCIRGSRLSGR